MFDLNKVSGIGGWMNNDELLWLYSTAQEMDSILEIGSWCGKSTTALCSGCRGIVYAVDHFRGSDEHKQEIKNGKKPLQEYFENMKEYNNLITIISESARASLYLQFTIDMVFIDGSHDQESVLRDIAAWGYRAKKMVAGHDWGYASVGNAVRSSFVGQKIESIGSIWYVRRGQ